ncbi:MAG: hypothetical protein V4671_22265, partial [Armatimonadota bacterium]
GEFVGEGLQADILGAAGDIDVTGEEAAGVTGGAEVTGEDSGSERNSPWEPLLDSLRDRLSSDMPINDRERQDLHRITELAVALTKRGS